MLDDMYAKWPFFKVTMDMMAMVLAKGDEMTLSMYEAKLVEPELHPVGNELRASFRKARQAVLSIVGDASVLGSGAAARPPTLLHPHPVSVCRCQVRLAVVAWGEPDDRTSGPRT